MAPRAAFSLLYLALLGGALAACDQVADFISGRPRPGAIADLDATAPRDADLRFPEDLAADGSVDATSDAQPSEGLNVEGVGPPDLTLDGLAQLTCPGSRNFFNVGVDAFDIAAGGSVVELVFRNSLTSNYQRYQIRRNSATISQISTPALSSTGVLTHAIAVDSSDTLFVLEGTVASAELRSLVSGGSSWGRDVVASGTDLVTALDVATDGSRVYGEVIATRTPSVVSYRFSSLSGAFTPCGANAEQPTSQVRLAAGQSYIVRGLRQGTQLRYRWTGGSGWCQQSGAVSHAVASSTPNDAVVVGAHAMSIVMFHAQGSQLVRVPGAATVGSASIVGVSNVAFATLGLAIDAANREHLVYLDGANGTIKWSWRDTGSWQTPVQISPNAGVRLRVAVDGRRLHAVVHDGSVLRYMCRPLPL